MKKQFLALSIITALSACGGSDDDNTNTAAQAPEITGDFVGTATKAVDPTGRLVVNDANSGESLIYPVTIQGKFGDFFINAAGEWKYTLDDDNEDVIALVSSDMPSLVEDAFTIETADGTTRDVAIAIDGIDVPATFGGARTFSVFYDEGDASATLTVRDANPAEAFFAPDQTPTAMYGAVTFDSDSGEWTYDLDESNADAMALNYMGEVDAPPTLDDTFTVTSLDGTEQNVVITIKGSQLVAADIDGIPGAADVEPAEGEEPVLNPDVFVNINAADAQGMLTITDPNFDQEKFAVIDNMTSTYGSYSIDESGAWTYTLNADLDAIKAHKGDGVTVPDALMDQLMVSSADGTDAIIPIMVNPLVGGNLTAEVGGGAADSIFRINMPTEAHETGSMTLKVNYAESGTKDAKIIFFGRSFNSDDKRTMAAITLRSNGEIKLMDGSGTKKTFALDQTHTPGQWHDVAFTWNATAEAKVGGKPEISLSIDGTPVTSSVGPISGEFFPSLSIAGFIVGIGTKLMQVSTKGDSGPVNVDDFKIYSDVAGTTEIYSQNFDDLAEGTELTLDISNSGSKGTLVVGPLAKP